MSGTFLSARNGCQMAQNSLGGPKWSRRAQNVWDAVCRVCARVWASRSRRQAPGARFLVCRVVSVRGLGRNGLEGPNSFMWCGGARGKVPNIEKCLGRALLA